jgi:hypothetical protein
MKNILLLITLFAINSYSQNKDTIYVDENYKKISLSEFERKTNSDFFVVATTTNDTAIFKKVRFREYFGKLNLKKKHQLNKLLYKKHKIDSSKIWLIHHTDTIPNIELFHKKSGIILLDSLGNEYGEVMNIKDFNSKHAKRLYKQSLNDNRIAKRVRSFEDYNRILTTRKKELGRFKDAKLLHFYNYNENYSLEKYQINWIKDNNLILENFFTDGNRIYNNVIIYPNGDCYAHSGRAPLWKQKKLLKKRLYNKLKKEWLKKYSKFN